MPLASWLGIVANSNYGFDELSAWIEGRSYPRAIRTTIKQSKIPGNGISTSYLNHRPLSE